MSNGYTVVSGPYEQVTPMGDGWHVVHHTEQQEHPWWAVRHECDDGEIWGMSMRSINTYCTGCRAPIPIELDGFIALMEWER